MTTAPISTPWGIADSAREVAPGLIKVRTPSHGGYLLDAPRQDHIAVMFPGFTPFTGSWRALEEDCDWALAALAWPYAFNNRAVKTALRIVGDKTFRYFDKARPWLDTDAGKALIRRIEGMARGKLVAKPLPGTPSAYFITTGDGTVVSPRVETREMAVLFAAAPALLTALQRLTHPAADDSDLEDARAAIALAQGGEG